MGVYGFAKHYGTAEVVPREFSPGTSVWANGHLGVITSEYMRGMYEVRLDAGTVVIPVTELVPADWCDETGCLRAECVECQRCVDAKD